MSIQILKNCILFLLYLRLSNCLPRTCQQQSSKFTSKSAQVPFKEYGLNFNIEFIDICYGIQNGLKVHSQYYLLDNTMTVDDKVINFLKINLKQFGFTVENVLGKGNYGVVFAAKSEFYGNVAIKIAANKDGAFYDLNTKQECCYYPSNMCNRCSKTINQLLPFEVASSVLTIDAVGVVKTKAFGIISTYSKLMFYIIVMEKIENSMTLLSFTQKCFKKFDHQTRLNYIRSAQIKLNEINKNLIATANIFHNDLKSDNILISLKESSKIKRLYKKCGNGKAELELYLIDFGNSIFNVVQKDQSGNSVLHFDQFKYKKYFNIYRAPDVSCDFGYVRLPQMLTWYLGVIAFEMCSNGVESFNLAPNPQICPSLKSNTNQNPNANSFDSIIRVNPKARALKVCFEPNMANHLQLALNFNPNTRLSSDQLMGTKLIQGGSSQTQ